MELTDDKNASDGLMDVQKEKGEEEKERGGGDKVTMDAGLGGVPYLG